MLYFLKNGVQGYQKWQSVRSTSQLYVCQPYQTRVVAQQSFQLTLVDLSRTWTFVFTHLQTKPKLQIQRSIFGPWLYGSLLQPFISNRGLSIFNIFGKFSDFQKNFRFSENFQIFRRCSDFWKKIQIFGRQQQQQRQS